MGKLQQKSAVLNDGDRLRALLDDCERGLASLSNGEAARTLVVNFDAVDTLYKKLQGEGLDMRAEEGRIESMETTLVRHANRVVGLFGGERAFARFREQQSRQSNDTFWGLDAIVAHGRADAFRKLAILAAALVCLAGLGYIFREQLFPPNPVGDAISNAEKALRTDDFVTASSAISAGLQITPSNESLLLWSATLLESQGFATEAQRGFSASRSRLGDRNMLIERGQIYLRLTLPERALADFGAVIALQPDLPDTYYLRASAFEQRKATRATAADRQLDFRAALDDLETCARLAEKQHSDVLLASAKLRIGMLMQSGQ